MLPDGASRRVTCAMIQDKSIAIKIGKAHAERGRSVDIFQVGKNCKVVWLEGKITKSGELRSVILYRMIVVLLRSVRTNRLSMLRVQGRNGVILRTKK